jgi:hypothetical protein
MTREVREDVAFETGTDAYSHEFDWDDDRAVSAVVLEAIEAVSGRDPTDLPPLHTAVEVDALNNLFAPRDTGEKRAAGVLSFPYADYHVAVHADGLVVVTDGEV